jgi:shikimate dehydrogenase
MTDKYAVIGNPIAHSKSPMIHQAFALQTGQDISYERILAPLDGFVDTVNTLIAQGYKGANVTVPFKFEAYAMADVRQPRTRLAGAANTMLFNASEITVDNTDGIGLVRDIVSNLNCEMLSKRVLLLGAGGAAEGVLLPLLECKPGSLVIANRTLNKAQAMVDKVNVTSVDIQAVAFEQLGGHGFDVVINATSAGLIDAALPIPDSIFADNCLAYDMMYGRETPFMAQARAYGAHVADGLGMLVEQAAEAFYLWRNVRPQTKPVMDMMRAM